MATSLPPRLAHLDIDASEIGKSYAVEEALVGDARAGLEMLLAELEHLGGDGASVWKSEQIKAIRDADDRAGEERCADALTVVRQVREGLPEDGILACDQSIACYWSVRHFRVEAPRRFLYPAGSARLVSGCRSGSVPKLRHLTGRSLSWQATEGSCSRRPSLRRQCSTTCR